MTTTTLSLGLVTLALIGASAGAAAAGAAASELSCWCTQATAACQCTDGAFNTTATAWGSFADTVEDSGWGELHIHSSSNAADADQAFAAGFVEGRLTAPRTAQHRQSFMEATFGGADNATLFPIAKTFLEANDAYVTGRIQNASMLGGPDASYWHQVSLVWAQLEGLRAGHNSVAAQPLTRLDFLLVNAVVDLSSLINKPFADDEWTEERAVDYARKTTHCSSMVKVLPDYSDLLTTHNTWTAYYMMLRVMKQYDLPYAGVASSSVLFPGYFGTLASTDDFFVLSNRLVVQETTNAVFNKVCCCSRPLLQPLLPT